MQSDLSLPPVRRAHRDDADSILRLVDALADYEHLNRPSSDARERLISDLFSERPRLECFLCEIDETAVGYAFVFET